jgi:Flp pilus assembly pilin Flp
MFKTLTKFLRDERGPELVEWAILTLVLLLASGLILIQIYNEVLAVMERILMGLLG